MSYIWLAISALCGGILGFIVLIPEIFKDHFNGGSGK